MSVSEDRLRLLALLLFAACLMAACQPQTEVIVTRVMEVEVTRVVTETVVEEGQSVEVTRVVTEVVKASPAAEAQPVTLREIDTGDIPNLDPQVAGDTTSINYIENLFVQLTNYDAETSEIVPEAATNWEVSDDGLTYTFHLRSDIPWVKYNPATGQITQEVELDEEGNEVGPRFVTAADFVYGIKRACDPNIGSYYSSIIAPLIVGCSDVLNYEDQKNIPQELVEAIGVNAPDPATLVINLEFPAGYFLSMTPMWTLTATPQWTVEAFGDDWVEAGRIVTNGRYVLAEWIHDVRRAVVRNPLTPVGMAGNGNIERWETLVVPDETTGYALWLNNEVDYSGIPDGELQAHLEQFPEETVQNPGLAVYYISFRETKPPFDDARVRRAFSAAFDRETFVREVKQGQGAPMTHFAPPGIFGAPPIDEVGLGFDPEYARQQLADAGYPNCEGFPQVSLVGFSGQNTLNWIEFAQGQWREHLGCSADLIQIEQMPFAELLAAIDADVPDEQVPHMWTLGWGPDYADENNWVGDVLWCGNAENRQKRECNEIDDLIVQAREETDPQTRIALYRQIEEMLFGPEGEVPFFPIWVNVPLWARHSWYQTIPALFGGQQVYNETIDQSAQLAATGR